MNTFDDFDLYESCEEYYEGVKPELWDIIHSE